jgi:hypothetical protein
VVVNSRGVSDEVGNTPYYGCVCEHVMPLLYAKALGRKKVVEYSVRRGFDDGLALSLSTLCLLFELLPA